MASDFHTHIPRDGINALISSAELLPGHLTSLEIHPWYLPETFSPALLPDHEKLYPFAAVGEIGLDKLRGPESVVQEQFLRAILDLAADTCKPVVIHAVRSYPEIFAILKHYRLKVMIHGFRSSPEMLDELWRKKFTVSFHPSALNNPALMNKLRHASGKFGFESDASNDIDIRDTLDSVAAKFAIPDLEKMTDQYFADFLEI